MVEWKKLGDICEKTSNIKWKDQADDKIYKYIDLSSVSLDSHKVIVTTDVCKQNAPSRAQQIVCANDILLGTTRPTLKRYCQIPSYLDKNICSTGFCIFRANKEYVLSRWLFHNIGSSRFWDYCELKQQGAGYPCLSNSDAFAYMIPIPSIEEQNRIVGILDTFTASIDNLKEQIAQRRKQYEFYRDQLLDLEGKEGVEMKTIKEVCKKICSGGTPSTSKKDYYGGNIPWLRTQEVDWKDIWDTDIKITEDAIANSSAKLIPKDCVIVAMYGATAAKVAINKIPLSTNQACCNLEINNNISSYRYVYYWLCKEYQNLKGMGEGSQNNINGQKIKDYSIPLPSLQEQQRIVSILDTFEASIQNLEAQLSQREKQYDYYRNKLLTFE